jgi:hypothetical protein
MLQPGLAGGVQTHFLDDQTKQICGMFNTALAEKYPSSTLPVYSPEAQELLRGAWLLAKQMRNRLVTREHLIVALLRGRPSISLEQASAKGYDDQALLAGALVRISIYRSYSKIAAKEEHNEDPLLTDSLARHQDDVEFLDEAEFVPETVDQHQPMNSRMQEVPLLRWINGAVGIAADQPLHPKHIQAYAIGDRASKEAFRYCASFGRPPLGLREWHRVEDSLGKKITTVSKRTDTKIAELTPVVAAINENVTALLQRQPDTTGHLVTLGRNLSSGLSDVSSKLATIDNLIATKTVPPFDPRPIVDPVTHHTTAAHSKTVELLSRPLDSLDVQSKAMLAKLIEISRQKPRPPSARRLTLLVVGSIAAGSVIGFLMRAFVGDPAIADFARLIGL